MKVVRIVTICLFVTAGVRSAHTRSPATSSVKILTARYIKRSSRRWNKSRRAWRHHERVARCRLCALRTRNSRGKALATPAIHESPSVASPSSIDLALDRTQHGLRANAPGLDKNRGLADQSGVCNLQVL